MSVNEMADNISDSNARKSVDGNDYKVVWKKRREELAREEKSWSN